MKISLGKVQKKTNTKFKLGTAGKKNTKLKQTGLFGDKKNNNEEEEVVVKIDSYDAEKEEQIKREKEKQERGDDLVIVPPKNRVFANSEQRKAKYKEAEDDDDVLGFGMNVRQGKQRKGDAGTSHRVVSNAAIDIGENPTAESYEQIPVEKFGLAFLKGLGYQEEDGSKQQEGDATKDSPKSARRPLFLGIGARENAGLSLRSSEMKYDALVVRKRTEAGKNGH